MPALLLLALSAGLRFVVLTRSESERQRRIDPESGLPNRRALNSRDGREGERYFLAARIDEFDALKQAVGEDNIGGLLRRLTERLQVAGSAGTVYRLDTGTLVWSSPLELADLEPLLAGLRAVMRSPFEVAGRRLGVSLAFGVAEADTADAPANAAHAANLAKRAGNPWRLYTADEGETAAQRFSLLGELDDALRDGQISVVYQPKLELATDRISAVEALVRWNHPVRGMLPPDMFIPLIEENNRIDDLTLAVLAKALGDMRDWSVRGLIVDVAVNISAGLLTSQSFASRALALVDRMGVPPGPPDLRGDRIRAVRRHRQGHCDARTVSRARHPYFDGRLRNRTIDVELSEAAAGLRTQDRPHVRAARPCRPQRRDAGAFNRTAGP
jgi:FOG: EAL domain